MKMKRWMMSAVALMVSLVASAVTVVDYDYSAATENSGCRSADSITDSSAVWSFSDVSPLIPNDGDEGQNARIYGGLMTTWTPDATYTPSVLNLASTDLLRVIVNPSTVTETNTTIKGMLVWNKANFLNGADTNMISFGAADAMSVTFDNRTANGLPRECRFVVKENGFYYVSSVNYAAVGAGSTSITPATDASWAVIDTSDYSHGAFATKQFTDVDAVGLYINQMKDSWNGFDMSDFQVEATLSPIVPTGVYIVDYMSPTNVIVARSPESNTDSAAVWDFSETTSLLSSTAGTNATVYGGLSTTWAPAETYTPLLRHSGVDGCLIRVNPSAETNTTLQGMLVWKKADFLNGGSSNLVSFESSDSISISMNLRTSTDREMRFVLKQGGTWYVSSANYTADSLFTLAPASDSWAEFDTATYAYGAFGATTFTNVEAVGFYISDAKDNFTQLRFDAFDVVATLTAPSQPEFNLSIGTVSANVVIGWQGDAATSYALQMKENLQAESWSNIVENISGLDGAMSVTNGLDWQQAFFRIITE